MILSFLAYLVYTLTAPSLIFSFFSALLHPIRNFSSTPSLPGSQHQESSSPCGSLTSSKDSSTFSTSKAFSTSTSSASNHQHRYLRSSSASIISNSSPPQSAFVSKCETRFAEALDSALMKVRAAYATCDESSDDTTTSEGSYYIAEASGLGVTAGLGYDGDGYDGDSTVLRVSSARGSAVFNVCHSVSIRRSSSCVGKRGANLTFPSLSSAENSTFLCSPPLVPLASGEPSESESLVENSVGTSNSSSVKNISSRDAFVLTIPNETKFPTRETNFPMRENDSCPKTEIATDLSSKVVRSATFIKNKPSVQTTYALLPATPDPCPLDRLSLSSADSAFSFGASERAVDVNERAVDINEKAVDVNERAVDVNKRAVDVNERAVDVNERAVDVRVPLIKSAVDVNERAVDVNERAVDVALSHSQSAVTLSSSHVTKGKASQSDSASAALNPCPKKKSARSCCCCS